MVDDPTLFGLRKLHLVRMCMAKERMRVGTHAHDLVSVGVRVYP